jgi:hypothetical protein
MNMNRRQTRFRACLSAGRLKNLSFAQENEFTFITAAGTFLCPSFVAQFLSPKIAGLRRINSTYCCYSISTGDKSSSSDFEAFLALGRGFSISVDAENVDYIRMISEEFENEEFCDIVCGSHELTVDTVVSRMKHRHDRCGDLLPEVEFAAEHIAELSGRCFFELDCSILREIVGHRKMQIESEDWLFDVLMSLIDGDTKWIPPFIN